MVQPKVTPLILSLASKLILDLIKFHSYILKYVFPYHSCIYALLTNFVSDSCVNSVIAKPNHDETLLLLESEDDTATLYAIRGYAYSGGGRRVTRVEISLDVGDSWKLAEMCVRLTVDTYTTVTVV